MAQYIKNDINFHGAKSKTRVVVNSSSKQDSHSKSKDRDDGWGSMTSSSRNNNNSIWDESDWSDLPHNPSVQEDAWGLVSGKSERNRKFRTHSDNRNFRVPIQSLPNWEEVDKEFPTLGSQRRDPKPNVWEKRKQALEEKAAIVPASLSEEETMIQRALELSKMETRQEEERRRQLEEEYRLQAQLLEANPDMFDEFRPGAEEPTAAAAASGFPALSSKSTTTAASGFVGSSSKSCNDYPETSSSDEFVDAEDDWKYSTKKTSKEKEDKKNEYPSKEEGFSQNSGLPSFSGNTATKPKIPKVVEMFGGWGHTKKPFTQDSVVTNLPSKSNKWETVDTNFVTRSSKKREIEDKPVSQLSTPAALEVKLDNTSNWDAIDAIDLKSATKEPVKRNYLGTRDTMELNLKDCEPGYSLDQKEQEFAIQSKKKNSKQKIVVHTEVKENTSTSKNEWHKTDACFEQERDPNLYKNYEEIRSEADKHGYQRKNSKEFQCIPAERNVGAKIEDQNTAAKIDDWIAGANIEDQNTAAKIDDWIAGAKIEDWNVGAKIEERIAGDQIEVGSMEDSDLQKSIENDYGFLLNHIDPSYTGAHSKDSNQRYDIPFEEKSDIHGMYSQPEFSQARNPTIDYFLSELGTQEDPTIPEPKPIKNKSYSSSNPQLDSSNGGQCNTNDINPSYTSELDSHLLSKMSHANLNESSLPTFGGYSTNAEDHHLPVGNDNMSHIEPPKVSVAAPELMNPSFLSQPRPVMTPLMNPALMNPALMMAMNPMLMQQMAMLSNPFFMQQLQQMEMYYKSLGMPLATGMPMLPQPMALPIPALHSPNLQAFLNPMSGGPCATKENGTIPPLIQTPVSQLPGAEASHLDATPPKVDQSDFDSFWFQDPMPTEASPSFIPPPKPTPVDAPTNPNVLPEGCAAASLSLNPRNTSREVHLDDGNSSAQPSRDSSSRTAVPGWEGGWGDLEMGSQPDNASGRKDDNANGW